MYKIVNQRILPLSKWEKIHTVNPSNYIRKGTLQVFQKIRRQYPKDYIICIGYDRGETQFVLTETFKQFEHKVEDVVNRCLREECSVERIATSKVESYVYQERHATIFCVPLRLSSSDFRPCSNFLEEDKYLNQNDDKTRKLVLLLHGDLPTIQQVFRNFYSIEKDIVHLLAIPCQEVPQVFPRLFPHHFYSFSSSHSYFPPTNTLTPVSLKI